MSISPNKARIHKEDSRFYNVQDGSEICTFPSVSRVLSHTKPVSFTFAMKRWEENMNKELGEEGTKKLRKELSTQGHNFHKVSNSVAFLCACAQRICVCMFVCVWWARKCTTMDYPLWCS